MATTNNKGAPVHGTPSTPHGDSNSAHDQRQRLLERLKLHGRIDTLTARRELDILCPAARVLELRKRGYQIETIWTERPTDNGKLHRVAMYVLKIEVCHE